MDGDSPALTVDCLAGEADGTSKLGGPFRFAICAVCTFADELTGRVTAYVVPVTYGEPCQGKLAAEESRQTSERWTGSDSTRPAPASLAIRPFVSGSPSSRRGSRRSTAPIPVTTVGAARRGTQVDPGAPPKAEFTAACVRV